MPSKPKPGKKTANPKVGAPSDASGIPSKSTPASRPHRAADRPDASAATFDWARHTSSIVTLLNQPAATALATAVSVVGFILALAPFIGSSTALAVLGIPMLLWGAYQFTFRRRNRAVRVLGIICMTVVGALLILTAVRPLVEPDQVRFYYDGSELSAPKGSPLAGVSFPPLTDDPKRGREVDQLFDPADLTVSCWVEGRYKGDDLEWASIVNGEYRTLWVPLATLGAMGRGAVRTVLPCSHWRWRLSRVP